MLRNGCATYQFFFVHLRNGSRFFAQRKSIFTTGIRTKKNICKMSKINFILRTKQKKGEVNLRFRLTDGRDVYLYHKSNIVADIADLAKLNPDGTAKPRAIVNKKLVEAIKKEMEMMDEVYREMLKQGMVINGDVFERILNETANPVAKEREEEGRLFLSRFKRYIEESFRDGVIGEGRRKHYDVLANELGRFLFINDVERILIDEVTAERLLSFRDFLFTEHKYVKKHRSLYEGMKECNIPVEARSSNTVAGKMKKLKAFFNDLEVKDEVTKSPFRRMGKAIVEVTKEVYDAPVYLTREEFDLVRAVEVPDKLQEAKDAFLLQCTLGCRIGDFSHLAMDNVAVRDGVPHVHYLPSKTVKFMREYGEIETPMLPFSYDIVMRYGFSFRCLKYVTGKSGYNQKIKDVLRLAGVDRECSVFDEVAGKNSYVPLWELGSSKLARKTFVDILNKAQINKYAAGLHSKKSDAVDRYTCLTLKDRYVLMCYAFGEELRFIEDKEVKR